MASVTFPPSPSLAQVFPCQVIETTAMEENSKRRKTEENEDKIDRLSPLPDTLLCHILSFLPTKTFVSTMTLVSRRYRDLWKHLQSFNFYHDYNPILGANSENFKRFAVFVNAVLTQRHSIDVRKMRLSCGYFKSQPEDPHAYFYDSWVRSGARFTEMSVDSWIRIAAGPLLEEMNLALFTSEDHGFRLPLAVLSCPNLFSMRYLFCFLIILPKICTLFLLIKM